MQRHQEMICLCSYQVWGSDGISPVILSRQGFSATGRDFVVECCECHFVLNALRECHAYRDIKRNHRSYSPSCSFTVSADTGQEVRDIYTKLQPILNKELKRFPAAVPVGKDTDDCAVASVHNSTTTLHSTSQDLYTVCDSILRRGTRTTFRPPSPPAAASLSATPSPVQSQPVIGSSVQTDRSNPDFEYLKIESVRFETFHDWPVRSANIVDPRDLAKAGLFFTGHSDRVQCAFCQGSLRNWVLGDKPLVEHRKHFPECPFVQGLETSRDQVDATQIAAMYVPTAGPRETARPQEAAVPVIPAEATVSRLQARHPEYADVNERKKSFRNGRVPAGQSIDVLTDAGFYYVGPEDNVRCFYCDGGLKNWQATDEPWTEHSRWFPRCPYMLNRKDQRFVHNAQVPRNATLTGNLPVNSVSRPVIENPVAVQNNVQYRIEPREIKARMDSPCVRSVIEMGHPRDLVRQTIERRLTTMGDDFPNIATLLEAIFEFEEERNKVSAMWTTTSSASMSSASTASISVPAMNSAATATVATAETSTDNAQKSKAKGKKKKKKNGANCSGTNVSALNVDAFSEDVIKLEEENRLLKEARTCRICMDVEINTVFLPCGHLVCCDGCARSLQQCPICRSQIRGTVKTFL